MTNDIDLNDIADELLIVDKRTIDHLFSLDDPADCVALYMFFYKTAKWQGNRSIKANDVYIRKCLGWGAKRVTNAKQRLEDAGMIKKVARRKNGKIIGHFIEVAYLLRHNTRKPLVDETTCGFGETNTNKEYIKYSNNIDKNIDTKVSIQQADKNEPVRTQRSLDIDQAFVIWQEVMGYPLAANKTDRNYINILLNKKDMDDYLPLDTLKTIVRQPLVATGTLEKYDVLVNVNGGGYTGQAGAIRHGISRALLEVDADFRPVLKAEGFLTRDPRMKERKKYGLKKARRAPQFSKR